MEKLRAYIRKNSIWMPFCGCWLWTKHCNRQGYGDTSRGRAHRLAYYAFRSDFDPKLCVLHTCDTPSCVNPNHLFLGTRNDNARDMVIKRRQTTGEKNGMFGRRGEKHPFFGKKHNPETKKKMSNAQINGRNFMRGLTGNKSPNFGLKRSLEVKQKMSEAQKKTWARRKINS